MPEVSVVLPTYNERDNIGPLIEAILANLEQPTQIIVVDDDSPDGTWQVVQEMATNDERIELLRRTDERGLTSALNAGIAHAKGDVIAWMDCDLSCPRKSCPCWWRPWPSATWPSARATSKGPRTSATLSRARPSVGL